jgi:hypothetical protein
VSKSVSDITARATDPDDSTSYNASDVGGPTDPGADAARLDHRRTAPKTDVGSGASNVTLDGPASAQ